MWIIERGNTKAKGCITNLYAKRAATGVAELEQLPACGGWIFNDPNQDAVITRRTDCHSYWSTLCRTPWHLPISALYGPCASGVTLCLVKVTGRGGDRKRHRRRSLLWCCCCECVINEASRFFFVFFFLLFLSVEPWEHETGRCDKTWERRERRR